MAALKENSKKVFNYVKEHDGEDIIAQDIADGTGLEVRQVNGIVTSAFQRKNLMKRTPGEVELEDGTHKAIKLVSLTDAGRNFDPDAEESK